MQVWKQNVDDFDLCWRGTNLGCRRTWGCNLNFNFPFDHDKFKFISQCNFSIVAITWIKLEAFWTCHLSLLVCCVPPAFLAVTHTVVELASLTKIQGWFWWKITMYDAVGSRAMMLCYQSASWQIQLHFLMKPLYFCAKHESNCKHLGISYFRPWLLLSRISEVIEQKG